MGRLNLFGEEDKKGTPRTDRLNLFDEVELAPTETATTPVSKYTKETPYPTTQQSRKLMGEQVEKSAKSLGRVVAGGGAKLIEGAATLPFDLVAALGYKDTEFTAENAKMVANKIRNIIPNVKPQGTLEDIGQTFIQYGVPSATAIKVMGAVTKGAPWAVRFMSELFAGGLGDFIAASPEDKTIPEALFGAKRKEGESALSRRAKIGAEGAIVPLGIQTVTGPVTFLLKGVGKLGTYLFSPQQIAENAIGSALVKQAIDPEEAIKRIKQSLRDKTIPGVERTSGTASDDIGLIGLERGVSSNPETSGSMLQRQELNYRAISDALADVTEQMGGNGQAAKTYFEDFVDQRLSGKVDIVAEVEKRADSLDNEIDSFVSEFAQQGGKQADASILIDEAVKKELNAVTKTKNDLYAAIDPGNIAEIPKERIGAAFRALVRKTSRLDSIPSKISGGLKQRLKSVFYPTKKQTKKAFTFGELTDLRKDLSDEIATARRDDQGGLVERLVTFKKAVEAETDFLIEGGSAAGARAAQAKKFYEEEYIPRFKEGVGDVYRKAVRSGKPIPPTGVGKRFLESPIGARESAEQLKLIIGNTPTQGAVRQHIISNIADKMVGANGKVAHNRLVSYLNNRSVKETLEQFPSVKNEIETFRKQLGTSLEQKNTLSGEIKEASINLKKTEKELRRSATKFYVNSDPVSAMGNVLLSPDPYKSMSELVSLAKKDTTGEALGGLKESLSDYLKQSLRGTRQRGGVEEVMRAKVVKLFQNKPVEKAMGLLYKPHELSALKAVRNELQILDRINKQVISGSPTAPLQKQIDKARIVLLSMYGIVKGRGLFAISNFVMGILGRDPKVIANKLLTDAMLNPDLAATLMEKNLASKAVQAKVKLKLTTYIMNNLVDPIEEGTPEIVPKMGEILDKVGNYISN